MSTPRLRVFLIGCLAVPAIPLHDGKAQPVPSTSTPPAVIAPPAQATDEAPARPGRTCLKHGEQIITVNYSPDGKRLAAAGQGRMIRLWETATGKECLQLEGQPRQVWSVVFSPDSKLLAAASEDRLIRLWETATGKQLRQLEGHQGAVWSLAFTPDGKLMASGSEDGTVRVWDVATGKEQRCLDGHSGAVWPVAFAPDGKTLASGGKDGTIRLWATATGEELKQFRGHFDPVWPLAFTPDGKTLISGGWQDQSIRLWEVETGKQRCQFAHPGGVKYVAVSPDGRSVASGGGDGSTRLWELATGKERRCFEGHRGHVMGVAFAPDGRHLATGSLDTTLLVWDIPGALAPAPTQADRLAEQEFEVLWTDLAGADAVKAHQAIWALTAVPAQTVPRLRERLRPPASSNREKIDQFLLDLDDDSFLVREKASEELAKLGQFADPLLRKALVDPPSLEVRRRVERLLEKQSGPLASPEILRLVRAVEVLEHIGNREARQVLQALAQGQGDTWLTRETKGAMRRLALRSTAER
jgi:WD40 repeat protein